MANQDSPAAALFWRRRAAHLAVKLNFHHWLARLIPKFFVLLIALAIFELFRREVAWPIRWSEVFFLMGSAIVIGWAWLQARNHFCTPGQAMVRLETVLGLHNRLSAAEAGVVPWPEPLPEIYDAYAENWKLLVAPLVTGIIFLGAAHLMPVSHLRLGTHAGMISEPPEFTQVQNWINALKAEDLVQPDKLQDMQTALDKMRERSPQDWYTQNNLEAANSLKELMEQSMNSLAQDLSQADQAVQAMQQKADGSSDGSTLQPMSDALRKAGENLASGNLPLKSELLGQMRGGEGAQDKSLSKSQLQALHERLKKGEMAAQTAPRSNGGFGDEMKKAMAQAGGSGEGMGRCEGPGGPGSGGLGGGKVSAPLELQGREKTTTAGALTQVNNDDMRRASLGETLKITASDHAIDTAAYHGNQSAGAAQVEGSGGQAVWRSTYDPQEADTLSRFFK